MQRTNKQTESGELRHGGLTQPSGQLAADTSASPREEVNFPYYQLGEHWEGAPNRMKARHEAKTANLPRERPTSQGPNIWKTMKTQGGAMNCAYQLFLEAPRCFVASWLCNIPPNAAADKHRGKGETTNSNSKSTSLQRANQTLHVCRYCCECVCGSASRVRNDRWVTGSAHSITHSIDDGALARTMKK